jgi:hypothetical protein
MASYTTPRIFTYKAAGAIGKGRVVSLGADAQHVALSTAATGKHIGITQGDTQNAEELIEVALQGGGAKAIAGGTIARGDFLTSDAAGAVVTTTTGGDRVIGLAMDAAVAGDLLAVEVIASIY